MFFEQAEFERLLGHDLLKGAGFLAERLDLVAAGRAGLSPARRRLPFGVALEPVAHQRLTQELL